MKEKVPHLNKLNFFPVLDYRSLLLLNMMETPESHNLYFNETLMVEWVSLLIKL